MKLLITGGDGFTRMLKRAIDQRVGATVFGYHVTNPERFGVVEFSATGQVLSIEEKPAKPKSNYAITGLYFYDNDVVAMAKQIKPSARGELEITDLNNAYLQRGDLKAALLGRGFAWLDTGTRDSLMEAGHYVQTIETRQGLKIAYLEEISYRNAWLSQQQLRDSAAALKKTSYCQYLLRLAEENNYLQLANT